MNVDYLCSHLLLPSPLLLLLLLSHVLSLLLWGPSHRLLSLLHGVGSISVVAHLLWVALLWVALSTHVRVAASLLRHNHRASIRSS